METFIWIIAILSLIGFIWYYLVPYIAEQLTLIMVWFMLRKIKRRNKKAAPEIQKIQDMTKEIIKNNKL